MSDALAALVGPDAKGLSPNVVNRLKREWEEERRAWSRRDLSGDRWVYLWADGIYSGLRGTSERLCVLVIVGVKERGKSTCSRSRTACASPLGAGAKCCWT